MSLISNINARLLNLKTDLDLLNENIEKNETASKELKPTVNLFKELSVKRAELKKQSREKMEQLNTISEFLKETTGEESYGIFPLFNQTIAEQNSQQIN